MQQDLIELLAKIIDDIEATKTDITIIEIIKSEKLVNGEVLDNSGEDFDVSPYMSNTYEEIEV